MQQLYPISCGRGSCEQRNIESMSRHYDVVIERDAEGVYIASVPQLGGCHTQAESLDLLMERVREAILLCLAVEGEPRQDLEFVGVQRVTVAA
jgi:predicted RNase H-like HicB family nuclease